MRVRLDAGRQSQPNGRDRSALPGQPVQEAQFVEVVDDDAADARPQGLVQFFRGLVVAVEMDALSRETPREGHVQLPARNDVEVESFFLKQLGHRR